MITNFPSKSFRNRGGYLSTFEFIPVYHIQQFPEIINHTIAGSITVVPGTSWLKGYCTAETLQFADDPQKSANGTYYPLKLSGFTPGDSAELTDLLYSMEFDTRFIVKITTPGKKVKVIGSPRYPLDFKAAFNSGDQRTSGKGYTWQFTTNALHRALQWNP